jgi:hypothetical protein
LYASNRVPQEVRPLPVREIAKRERLTPVYVEKILVNLRRAGLVKSLRGVNGGYIMAMAPKGYSVAAVSFGVGAGGFGAGPVSSFYGKFRKLRAFQNDAVFAPCGAF